MSVINEQKVDTHESYGSLVVTRSQGGSCRLFGSSIKHNNFITVSLHQANMERMLSSDWLHTGRKLFEVRMSQNQWAQFVSSIGIGEGTPCTISWNNVIVEQIPDVPTKQEQFDKEFKDVIRDALWSVSASIDDVSKILDKRTVSRAELKQVMDKLSRVQSDMKGSLTFVEKQFTEQMERTVSEAKSEVEAYVLSTMQKLATMAVKESLPEVSTPIMLEKDSGD